MEITGLDLGLPVQTKYVCSSSKEFFGSQTLHQRRTLDATGTGDVVSECFMHNAKASQAVATLTIS